MRISTPPDGEVPRMGRTTRDHTGKIRRTIRSPETFNIHTDRCDGIAATVFASRRFTVTPFSTRRIRPGPEIGMPPSGFYQPQRAYCVSWCDGRRLNAGPLQREGTDRERNENADVAYGPDRAVCRHRVSGGRAERHDYGFWLRPADEFFLLLVLAQDRAGNVSRQTD